MKLLGCDRCKAIYPAAGTHTVLGIFRVDHVIGGGTMPPPSSQVDLCPVCRSDLDAFLAGAGDVASIRAPAVKPLEAVPDPPPATGKRKSPTWGPERTCEICGRTGVQRFVRTPTGWRCSATVVKCPGNHAPTSDIPAKQFAAEVTPTQPPPCPTPPRVAGEPPSEWLSEPAAAEPPPPDRRPTPPDVTARCKDCSRTWNLTGFILEKATEMHELKHGHIVDLIEGVTA